MVQKDQCDAHAENMGCLADLNKNFALLQKDVEYLRRDQETILARFGKHVEDAEKSPGGRHERLRQAEIDIQALHDMRRNDIAAAQETRRNDMIVMRWFMIGSGVIGGLIGSKAPGVFMDVIHFFLGK